ncbi:hypothetical protein GY45DRAFT_1439568 [Cubamyces sp. BRFM 1775]|nr:hypothetical protein GY45DRAFT_1439568 [Cubamyces sp. BRFM 1775]
MELTTTPDLWPAAPALGATFGAVQLGTYLTLMLFGAFALQVHRYIRLYHMDCALIRGFVTAMMALEIFHVVLCMHVCYFYLVSNFSHQDRLLRCVWSINLLPLNTGLAIFVFQAFFARRVYLISSKYRLLVVVAMVLSFVELGFMTAATVEAFQHQTFDEFWKDTWTVSAALGASVTCDVLLTGVLVYVLHHSRTAFGRTDSIIDGLIAYAMNTGLLIGCVLTLSQFLMGESDRFTAVSMFNVAALVFALVLPDNLIYAAVMIVATSLYANSLMAVLNARQVFSLSDRHEPATAFRIEHMTHATRSQHSEAEQWNVPQDLTPRDELKLDDDHEAVLVGKIMVTTETVNDIHMGPHSETASTDIEMGPEKGDDKVFSIAI